MERQLLVLLAETPVHAGGAAADGAVDLPIQREASTGLPVIWGQSLKGALRDAARGQSWEQDVFGAHVGGTPAAGPEDKPVSPADPGGELKPGSVSFGDAQLLAFPAATLRETFAWTTSRQLLSRLRRKARLLGADLDPVLTRLSGVQGSVGAPEWKDTQVIGPYVGQVHGSAALRAIGAMFARLSCPAGADFEYTRHKLGKDLLVLEDEVFSDLARLGTDVVARVQLNPDQKTVENGPFYSEHLPAETLLVAVLAGKAEALGHLATFFHDTAIQLGGDETIGKGVLWCRVLDATAVTKVVTGVLSPEPTGV